MKLRIATCQFPIDTDPRRNLRYVLAQMQSARRRGAVIAHFPEACLGGYAGVEFPSFEHYDWERLRACTRTIQAEAKRLGLWVVLGSNHPLTGCHKPHNCLYLIDGRGQIVDRYDKMFCMGPRDESASDLKHYSPGSRFVVFRVKGVTCALQICYDFRFPEMYRELKKRGVQIVFHSYHNGHKTAPQLRRSGNIWAIVVPAVMQAYAANNALWVSAANTTRRQSCWGSFVVRPDGRMVGRLPRHRAGLLLTTVDTRRTFYDPSEPWRGRAMRGIYHSGRAVDDPRSRNRTAL